MLIQKYPSNSHIMIVRESSSYGEMLSKNAEYVNYSAPLYVHSASTDTKAKIYDSSVDSKKAEVDDNLFRSIHSFLIFGKLIGVLPFSGIFTNSWQNMTFRRKSVAYGISCGITVTLIMNALFGFNQSIKAHKRNALELAEAIRATLYYVWGCAIYIYFLWRGDQFLKIFHVWHSIPVYYLKTDNTLRRDTLLITGVILTSAVLENGVLHLTYFREFDTITGNDNKHANMSGLETYYMRAHAHWANAIGYHWVLAVLCFFQHKWNLYAWNYMDMVLAVFGRAIYFRFKSLCKETESKLLGPEEMRLENSKKVISEDQNAWVHVVNDHQNLCRLLDVMESFFSPIVFASYSINMFYICLQLFDELTSDASKHSIVYSIYAPWSFLHLVMRTFIVSICCARINEYAHHIQKVFRECPIEHYTAEISRVDKRVSAGPDLGLSGLGTFTVTKPFILSILSVVFTFEIVLLQSIPSTNSTTATSSC